MATWVDYMYLKESISIEQVLAHYNLLEGAKRKGENIVIRCPFHTDSKPSFSASSRGFHCFAAHCKAKGNVLDLVQRLENLSSTRAAALKIQALFGLTSQRPPKRERADAAKEDDAAEDAAPEEQDAPAAEAVNPPLQFTLQPLDATHPYLALRGLTPDTIATFGVGFYAGKGMMRHRIIAPVHNERGELIAYLGRWPGEPPEDTPKYLLPAKFHKAAVLFNVHRAREHAGEGLIVVEGVFDVFTLWQKGRRNVVAILGSVLSAEQERLIVETVGSKGRVLLAFDADDAGRKGMQDAATRLAPQVFVRTVELADQTP